MVRDPRAMLLSLSKIVNNPTLRDTGLKQQCELFRSIEASTGKVPLVINSMDILVDPETSLRMLCNTLELPFYNEMLAWPAGPRETDGAWAKWWYDSVIKSTGFKPHTAIDAELTDDLKLLLQECMPYYDEIAGNCLVIDTS